MLESLIIDGKEISARNIGEINIKNGCITIKCGQVEDGKLLDDFTITCSLGYVKFVNDDCNKTDEQIDELVKVIEESFKNHIRSFGSRREPILTNDSISEKYLHELYRCFKRNEQRKGENLSTTE